MFTGIITAVGRIAQVEPLGPGSAHGRRLTVETPAGWLGDTQLGDSIAINGACMTVVTLAPGGTGFTVEVSAESLARTAGLDQPGLANLEQSLRAHDKLGGHLVSGHVDGVGRVTHFAPVGESWELRILAPRDLGRFVARKGSVAVNGVSLTVNRVDDLPEGCEFSINLIPHTVAHTNLHTLHVRSRVNLEIDLIARYVERMLALDQQDPPPTIL
jgi:riboflavin synthase